MESMNPKTKAQKARYRIKNFGNDAGCDRVEELRRVLFERYRGKSVSILYPSPKTELDLILFVDVPKEGDEIRRTYGTKDIVDLETLA